jgi:hypothetical protein
MNKKNNIAMVSSAILAVFAAVQVHAGITIYHEGDLLLSFRAANPAASGAGSKDLTVDLGNINTFLSSTYSQGGTVDLTSYLSGVDFTSLFGGANNLQWSASATVNPGLSGNLWTTRTRNGNPIYTIAGSTPWNNSDTFSQPTQAQPIESVGLGLNVAGTALSAHAGTTTDLNNLYSYHNFVTDGSYNQSFGAGAPGVETGTGVNFTGAVSADFYQVLASDSNPGQPGTYEGYFTFGANDTLTFTAVPEPATLSLFAVLGLLGAVSGRALGLRKS